MLEKSDSMIASGEIPRENLPNTFHHFREQCIWLRACLNTFEALYSTDEATHSLLKKTAPCFFFDLNKIFVEYIILQICNLTDPAESHHKNTSRKRQNLTILHINDLLSNDNLITPDIKSTTTNTLNYRHYIIDSRNKPISHFDKQSIIDQAPLGEHSKENLDSFFRDLQLYCDLVGTAISDGPLDFNSTSCAGDVCDLLKYLKAGEIEKDLQQPH